MKINRAFWNMTIIFIVLVFVLDFSSYFVESVPVSLANREAGSRMFKVVNQYEFPDYEIPEMQQGPRRRRYAFPIDVQDFRVQCPVGQKLHSSGVRCVPNNDEGDDY